MKAKTAAWNRRAFIQTTSGAAGLAVLGSAFAQDAWPARPIRVVVPYPAGGGTDVMVRALGQVLASKLNQSVVVDNRPGALGNIAISEVIRAKPDGYTVLISTANNQTINPHIIKSSPDMAKNLVPVSVVGRFTYNLVIRKDLEARNLQELVQIAKKRPGALNYGSYGTGSLTHLLMEAFQQAAGIQVNHVPYKGSAPVLQAMLSKEIDLMFDPGLASQYIQAGSMTMLAVATETRSPRYPNIPTFAEAGFPMMDSSSWIGLWVPAGTPSTVTSAIEAGISSTVSTPELGKRFSELSFEAKFLGASDFQRLLERESKVMADLIKRQGIKIEN